MQVFNEKGLSPLAPGEVIYGLNGRLNSMSLVRLIVELENQVEEHLGHTVILTDNKVLSMKQSPFKTADSLSAYIKEKVADVQ